MEVTIGGKPYKFEVTGDVGVIFTAEMLLRRIGIIRKGEPIDYNDNYQLCAMLYSVISLCNKSVPGFDDFMKEMTGARFQELMAAMNDGFARYRINEENKEAEAKEGNA